MYRYLVFAVLLHICSCSFSCGPSTRNIDVSISFKHNTTSCMEVSSDHVICASLEAAFKTQNLTSSCIRINEKQTLRNRLELFNVSHVYLSANGLNRVLIECTNNSGFQFFMSDNIHISHLDFFHCGMIHNSTGYIRNETIAPIWAAFYFKNVANICLLNCSIIKSFGYGVIMYDVAGQISLERVNMFYSQLVSYKPGFNSAGGLYVEYTANAGKSYAENTTFSIQGCNIYSNKGDNTSAHPTAEGLSEGHVPFARGAGIVMFFLGKARNNTVVMKNSYLGDNTAAWGGSLYVRFRDEASLNKIHLHNMNFSFNRASFSGGAACIVSTQIGKPYQNKVNFYQCRIIRNYAKIGAGFSLLRLQFTNKEGENMIINNCVFKDNVASLGSAMQVEHQNIAFKNVNITNNNIETVFSRYDGRGTVYIFESFLKFFGRNFVINNEGSAFILDCADIALENEMYFTNNTGGNGGALALYGHSKIILKNNTSLVFKDNKALRKGGAVFVEIPGPSQMPKNTGKAQIYECFFHFQGMTSPYSFGGTVIFDNNTADAGASIFATTLQNCIDVDKSIDGAWKNFHVPNRTVVTRAVKIESNASHWNVSPGLFFEPKIVLIDELGNSVNETIDVDIIQSPNGSVQIETNNRFVLKNETIHLKLLGKRHDKFEVRLVVVGYGSTFKKIPNLSLTSCSFGYSFVDNQCRCNLMKNQAKGISGCVDNGIYLLKGRWADPAQQGVMNDTETTQFCPANYCNTTCNNQSLTGMDCLFVPKKPSQCVQGRKQSSRLCGQCLPGYSVFFGGETCHRCKGWQKYNAIWIIPSIFVVMALFVLFILWLNVDIYSNYLNGLLYYVGIVGLLKPSNFELDHVLNFVLAIARMEGDGNIFPSVCLWNGLNDLQKNTFNYIVPVSMISFLVIVSLYAKCKPDSYFRRQNCISAFTIISVIAYTDFTRVTLKILETVTIDGEVWVRIDAQLLYMGSEHLGYAVFAYIALVVIVCGLPILLILQPWLIGVHCTCVRNPLVAWKPIFDSFTYCFHDEYAWFSSYYFLSRALILCISSFTPRGPEQNVYMALVCFVVCVVFCIVLPYKRMWMNIFDAMVLGNLTAVAVLSLGMRSVYSTRDKETCATIIHILMYIPLIIVLGRLLYMYVPKFYRWVKKKLGKDRTEPALLRSLITDVKVETDEEDSDAIN